MTETTTRRLWVAHGPTGAVGTIRQDADTYTVTILDQDAPVGTYDSMETSKAALYGQLKPGSEWPEFREH